MRKLFFVFVCMMFLVCTAASYAKPTPLKAFHLNAVASDGKGVYVAVGTRGTIVYSGDNGQNWTVLKRDVLDNLRGIAYGNDTFVAVGSNLDIYVSKDGLNWELLSQEGWDTKVNLNGITYGDGIFVAVGSRNSILISADGKHWEVIRNEEIAYNNNLYAVTYGGGFFVAVGEDQQVIVSKGGRKWKYISNDNIGPTSELYGIVFNGTEFLAVGEDWDCMVSSPEKIKKWKRVEGFRFIYENLNCVTYGNGMYVAGGSDNSLWVSKVDESGRYLGKWERVSRDSWWPNDPPHYGACYANNQFVVVGGQRWGRILISQDGKKWESKYPGEEWPE